ncbi:hypothetical protein J7643_15055 [bacterium]|nr:hypothetical protein [bacterium]
MIETGEFYHHYVINSLSTMREYLSVTDSLYEKRLDEVKEEVSQQITSAKCDSEVEDGLVYQQYQEYALRDFKELLYKGVFLSCFSFVETELYGFCDAVSKSTGSKLNIDDLTGDGPQKIRKYLEKVAGYQIRDGYWNDFYTFSKIRNILTHEIGRIRHAKTLTLFQQFSQRFSGLTVEAHGPGFEVIGYIRINSKFCDDFINHVEKIFLELIPQLHSV